MHSRISIQFLPNIILQLNYSKPHLNFQLKSQSILHNYIKLFLIMNLSKDNITLLGVILMGTVAITVAAQYISKIFTKPKSKLQNDKQQQEKENQQDRPHNPQFSSRKSLVPQDKIASYGSLKIKNYQNDPILIELEKMSSLVNEIERVNNLIIDLNLQDVKLHPNPIIAHKRKLTRDDPFLSPNAITAPLSYVLHTTQINSAQMISLTKKWLRSGPRSTIYFQPSSVKAAIVSMGGMVPGVNTLIKQLVHALEQYYGVKQIIGIKYSFETNRRQSIDLNIERVKTIHHYGGSLLGVCRADVNPEEVADRLQNAGINQIYIIGGPGTLKLASELHEVIKKRKMNVAFCVIPKDITNGIPITQRSIGFQTALEESQRMVEAGYTESHAHDNGVSIIKVAGVKSGFLAVQSTLAARNVQACLVPQFPFQLYGEKGLLEFIYQTLKTRSNFNLIVAEGCNESILDYDPPVVNFDWDGTQIKEDINKIIKNELKKYLAERNVKTAVKTIDTFETRASPANAQDTRICCRYAAESIHGVMAGYTNFMIGSAMGRTIMIPLVEVNSGNYSECLTENCSQWTRLLLTTCQPSFVNDE